MALSSLLLLSPLPLAPRRVTRSEPIDWYSIHNIYTPAFVNISRGWYSQNSALHRLQPLPRALALGLDSASREGHPACLPPRAANTL